jgi:hypothetical protein
MSNITNSSITLLCSYGTLNEIVDFGQTKASQNVSCQNEGANFRFTMPECSYSEKMDNAYKSIVDTEFTKKCKGKTNCTFDMS